ncbi:MAG: pyridoxamine 5'-phosphate oxidase [Thalassotalea sp.]
MTLIEKLRCLFSFGQGVALPLPIIDETTTPTSLFEQWFNDAKQSGILLPESVAVSTCGTDGQPKSRMVLLKAYDQDGFIFYTNYGSDKSQQLAENQKIALLFHWGVLQRQIRIEGSVEKVDSATSAAYFHSRDRGSQIGAWASHQSKTVLSDEQLKEQVKFYENKFKGQTVPLPEFWGGWRVKPNYFEFWQGRASRLHDRLCFSLNNDKQWQAFKRQP